MALLTTNYPQFFAATILEWKPLLEEDKYKDIIVSGLKFLTDNNEWLSVIDLERLNREDDTNSGASCACYRKGQ